MSNLPKVQTKSDYIKSEVSKGNAKSVTFEVFFASVGSNRLSGMPTYGEQDEVSQRAYRDIRQMDFGDIGDYIDSLTQIADHWQSLAEAYFETLTADGYKFDNNGYPEEEQQ